jgi:hypothetical protein
MPWSKAICCDKRQGVAAGLERSSSASWHLVGHGLHLLDRTHSGMLT